MLGLVHYSEFSPEFRLEIFESTYQNPFSDGTISSSAESISLPAIYKIRINQDNRYKLIRTLINSKKRLILNAWNLILKEFEAFWKILKPLEAFDASFNFKKIFKLSKLDFWSIPNQHKIEIKVYINYQHDLI